MFAQSPLGARSVFKAAPPRVSDRAGSNDALINVSCKPAYEITYAFGVVTTCPSFTGSVAPGLKGIRTVPSFPSKRYVTL